MTAQATRALGEVLPDGSVWPEDAIEVARIVDAWGIKGGIKVLPFSSDPQALFCTKKWFVRPAEPGNGAQGVVKRPASLPPLAKLNQPRLLSVVSAREQGEVIVATIDELQDRNAAEALKGARVFVSRSAFPTPDEDEFYWIDLIGLNVVNRDGAALGEVVDLMDTGPHCVLRCVIKAEAGQEEAAEAQERLIPFVSAYIDRVSLAERLIVADWGLDY